MRSLATALILASLALSRSGDAASEAPAALKAVLAAQAAAVPGFDPSRAEKDFEALWTEAVKLTPMPTDPEQVLDRIYRFLMKERKWEALDAGPDLPRDLVFVSGVLREGRGAQPAIAVVAFLMAERAGVPARLAALPNRLVLGVPSAKGVVYLDPAKGPPFKGQDAVAREAGMLDGMRETDVLFPLESGKIAAYLRSRLAFRLLAGGENRAALDHFSAALAEVPSPEILYGYGSALLACGDPRAADVLAGLAQNPSFFQAKAHAQLARLRLGAGNVAGARAAVAEAAKLSASEPLVPHTRGLIAAFERRWDDARAEFEAALAIAPDWDDPRLALLEIPGIPAPEEGSREHAAERALELLRGTLSTDLKVAQYDTAQILHLGARAAPAFFHALASGDERLRLQAVRLAPSVLPGHPGHAVLQTALRDPATPVQSEAVTLVVKHEARSSAGHLHRLLERLEGNPDPAKRALGREAAYALLAFGAEPEGQRLALARVLPDLSAKEAETRLRAATILAKATGPRAADAARGALADADPRVRAAAAGALARIGEASAIPDLIQALSDTDDAVRSSAAAALERLGRQPFGADAERWRAWWSKKKK